MRCTRVSTTTAVSALAHEDEDADGDGAEDESRRRTASGMGMGMGQPVPQRRCHGPVLATPRGSPAFQRSVAAPVPADRHAVNRLYGRR
jgi:hypothetical protein